VNSVKDELALLFTTDTYTPL